MAVTSAQAAKHSSASVEHYTPRHVIECARVVMGGIDLDPASCEAANTIVGAQFFFSREEDGLSRQWAGKVWLNPPGGKTGNTSNTKAWWNKLVLEYSAGHVEQAVFLAFNIEFLSTSQVGCSLSALSCPVCVPSRRIAFLCDAGDGSHRKVGRAPTHANAIIGLGVNRRDFRDAFLCLGHVVGA